MADKVGCHFELLCLIVYPLCCATIWAISNIENDIRKFGVKFEVELYSQHRKPIYNLKAYNFRIAIFFLSLGLGSHDLSNVTPSLMEFN